MQTDAHHSLTANLTSQAKFIIQQFKQQISNQPAMVCRYAALISILIHNYISQLSSSVSWNLIAKISQTLKTVLFKCPNTLRFGKNTLLCIVFGNDRGKTKSSMSDTLHKPVKNPWTSETEFDWLAVYMSIPEVKIATYLIIFSASFAHRNKKQLNCTCSAEAAEAVPIGWLCCPAGSSMFNSNLHDEFIFG